MVRQWLLAVVVLFAGQAGAVEYFWIHQGYYNAVDRAPHYASAAEACRAEAVNYREYPLVPPTMGSPTARNPTAPCAFITSTGKFTPFSVVRYGDACENGRVWDDSVLGCKCPEGQEEDAGGKCVTPRSCEADQQLLTRGPNSPATIVSGRVYILSTPPSTVCSGGCQYGSASSKAASCYLVSGSSDTGFCNYTVTSDGERCSGEDAPGPDVGDPPNSEVPPDSPTQPTDPDDPGCPEGQSWSGDACVAGPTGEGDEGGGTDAGEDDDSGDPCDIEGDCWEEDEGGGSGNGNGNGNGGGDGSGTGDGDGDDDGEGECDPRKGYVCGGGKGPESGLNAPEFGSWDKANEEWDQRLDEAKKELKDTVKANVDQMKSAFNLQLSAGGGQLPCDSISVWGKSYRFCVADYGEQLINLRLALLLMAAVIAALIILKE